MVTSKSKAPLRFGALIRVSTEKQAKRGESLSVQRKQIEAAVQSLAGKVHGWYGGAEHATAGFEKKEVDRLLADATRKRFDAVIVATPDRWSRDNLKSQQGLQILRDADVRFFILSSEHDLYDEQSNLILTMYTAVSAYVAGIMKRKSLASRIERAQKGYCVGNRRPFGRIWDKEQKTWSIDAGKQALIKDVAARYLRGESLLKLAEEIGMNHSNLHQTLIKRCGPIWVQTFYPDKKAADKGPPVVTETTVPELLAEPTIRAIREKMKANRTYAHGPSKYRYVLARMIFCSHCGASMSGQTNRFGTQYYRHFPGVRREPCQHPHSWITADEIEQLVMIHLFNLFGNPVAVQKAIEKASPDLEKLQQYQENLSRVTTELDKIERGRERIARLVLKGDMPESTAEKSLAEVKGRETILLEEQGRLSDFLSNRPSREQIELASKKAVACIGDGKPFSEMTWEEKRGLVQAVFGGKTPDGKRMGVYIAWNDDADDWTFDILGHVAEWRGYHRLSEKNRARMRDILDEDGPTNERGQKALFEEVSNFVEDRRCG